MDESKSRVLVNLGEEVLKDVLYRKDRSGIEECERDIVKGISVNLGH